MIIYFFKHPSSLKLISMQSHVFILLFFRQKIPLVMAGRRPGDAEIVYASTAKAERELNWK